MVRMKNQKGFSMVECMVALTIGIIALSIAADVFIQGSKSLKEECVRIVTHDESRLAFTNAVKMLRDSAIVIHSNDLNYDGVSDGTPKGVHYKLDDPLSGKPVVRGGLLAYTDEKHVTIFYDGDSAGSPGHFYPDVSAFDDRDGDGKSDVVALGLVPQDLDDNGQQDAIPRTSFVNERLPAVSGNGSSGYSPYYWKLVMVTFKNISEASNPSKWKAGRALAYNLVPYITNFGTENERYDIITYEGSLPDNFDYGHDGTFGTHDTGEGDGVVDETEIGYSDPNDFDGVIKTPQEIRNIVAIKIKLRKATRVDPIRFDISAVETGITPRAFAMVLYNGLRYPIPVL